MKKANLEAIKNKMNIIERNGINLKVKNAKFIIFKMKKKITKGARKRKKIKRVRNTLFL